MFEAVSDEATKQDCATVLIETELGKLTIEYGAFARGALLNIPTGDHDPEDVKRRVVREPLDSGKHFVVYDVDGMAPSDVAELALGAAPDQSRVKITKVNLRTIETGGLSG